MIERDRDPEQQGKARAAERPRAAEPAPALAAGTLPWASAVGNAAVARLARQTRAAGEEEETETETEAAAGAPEPEAGAETDAAGGAGTAPEEAAGLEQAEIPEDELPE